MSSRSAVQRTRNLAHRRNAAHIAGNDLEDWPAHCKHDAVNSSNLKAVTDHGYPCLASVAGTHVKGQPRVFAKWQLARNICWNGLMPMIWYTVPCIHVMCMLMKFSLQVELNPHSKWTMRHPPCLKAKSLLRSAQGSVGATSAYST